MNYPRELLDPEGEGIYLYDDGSFPGIRMRASIVFFGDWREWRNVRSKVIYMREGDDELWYPVKSGWRTLLPRRWQPTLYHYCTPIDDLRAGDRHAIIEAMSATTFALREVKNIVVGWLRWIPELSNRWEPQFTWQEFLRVTVIETTLAIGIIWLGEAIF